MKTAALIIIGDEILTGKIKDENSIVFTRNMFDLGINVKRIVTIPDHIETIAEEIKKYKELYDYVCTSGGVGPTHDDRTLEGVAQAFGLKLLLHKEAFSYFKQAQIKAGRGPEVSSAQQKMLMLPELSEVFFVEPLWLPLIKIKNVYVFPGVPYLFERLMAGCKKLFFGGRKFFRQVIYTDKSENSIAETLNAVQEEFPEITIGSYPQMPKLAFSVMVTIEGIDETMVSLVTHRLLPMIDGRKGSLPEL